MEKEKEKGRVWGYDVPYLLTGIMNCHPSSAIKFVAKERNDYGIFITSCWRICSSRTTEKITETIRRFQWQTVARLSAIFVILSLRKTSVCIIIAIDVRGRKKSYLIYVSCTNRKGIIFHERK